MKLIINNKTLEMATIPAGHRAIELKWVFKVKMDPAGQIVKHKAKLVDKVYAHQDEVDYEDMFVPMSRMETVRLLLTLDALNK